MIETVPEEDGLHTWMTFKFVVHNAGGQRLLAGMAVDVTEHRRAEESLRLTQEQLRQSQKLESVGRLAGGIAHDFNNLLTAVIGHSELLLRQMPPDDSNRRRVEEIRKAGDRAAALTGRLLAFSRKQILQPRVLDVNSVVTDVEGMLGSVLGEDISLRTFLAPDAWNVLADPNQITQVVMNLAVNARDAMPQGGLLTVETANVYLDEGYAARHVSVKPSAYLLLAVSDTGTGMDAATREQVFEPFFTTKEQGKGTGLGLSTVYGIVKQSGGNVWVYSEPGIGTTFKVYLPRVEEEAEPVRNGNDSSDVPRGTETVLLVEDEDAARSIAREALELYGYRVVEASGGEEAVSVFERQSGEVSLVVTDVVMPDVGGSWRGACSGSGRTCACSTCRGTPTTR